MPSTTSSIGNEAVALVGAASYPLIVYFGTTRFQPRYLALFLALLMLLKLLAGSVLSPLPDNGSSNTSRESPANYAQAGAALLVLGLVIYAIASNQAFGLKLYPVAVNFSLLLGFGWSLLHPPSVIERIARISAPRLPAAGVRYTRRITLVWCLFFLCNGLAGMYTALYASFATWALYNGLIAYVLIACLLGGELLYRHRFLKKEDDLPR